MGEKKRWKDRVVDGLKTLYTAFSGRRNEESEGSYIFTARNSAESDRIEAVVEDAVDRYVCRRGIDHASGAERSEQTVTKLDYGRREAECTEIVADLVSLPKSSAVVPLLDLLPEQVAQIYSSDVGGVLLDRPAPPPDMNVKPIKCESQEWDKLVRKLDELKMVDFVVQPKSVSSVFTLSKPDGRQRFIINATGANELFTSPSNPELPTPDLVAALVVESSQPLYAAKVDLECFYFHLGLPQWLVPYFAMPAVRAGDVSDELGRRFGPDTFVFPCCNRLPMGWSHSVFLAQTAHMEVVMRKGVFRREDRIDSSTDKMLDRTRWSIFIDDLFVLGKEKEEVKTGQENYLTCMSAVGLPVNLKKVVLATSDPVSIMGVEFVGKTRVYGMAPEKMEELVKETERLISSERTTGRKLSELIGKWTWCMCVRRPMFAIFSNVFKFIEMAGERLFDLWRSVRRELALACSLAPLFFVSLSSPWFFDVIAVDASLKGQGVVAMKPNYASIQAVASLPRQQLGPGLMALEERERVGEVGVSELAGEKGAWETEAMTDILHSKPRVIVSAAWDRQEHINALELRAVQTAIRWAMSRPAAFSTRLLLLTDSAVAYFSLLKGRCSSTKLLIRVRAVSALLLATSIRLTPAWVPSALNPADEPSRVFKSHLTRKQRNKLQHAANGNTDFKHGSSYLRFYSVAPKTLKLYSNAVRDFVDFVALLGLSVRSLSDLDSVFERYVHWVFERKGGVGLGSVQHALYGLCLYFPPAQRALPFSARAIAGWKKIKPSVPRPPLPWPLAVVMASHLIISSSRKRKPLAFRAAVGILVGWEAYLRIGELVAITSEDVVFVRGWQKEEEKKKEKVLVRFADSARLPANPRSVVLASIRLKHTKTGPNKWAQVRSSTVAQLLHALVRATPSGCLFPFSTDAFRKAFNAARDDLDIKKAFTPHSLRHGHATADYESGVEVKDIALRGRWVEFKSVVHYVQSGPVLFAALRPPAKLLALADAILSSKLSLTELYALWLQQ